jgi:dethiobiotin synthetase
VFEIQMPPNFLITGTDTRVGKTTVGCALAFAFKVRGMRVGVMQPVATGCTARDGVLMPADAAALLASASADLPLELVAPYRYQSQLAPVAAAAADGASPPDFAAICAAYRQIATSSDVMLVEESGGLAAPLDWHHNFADFALEAKLEPLLVVANRGGFISAAALTIDYAARRGIPVRGFILNALDRDASAGVERDAQAVTRTTGTDCLGTVRFKEPLSLAIVERLLG